MNPSYLAMGIGGLLLLIFVIVLVFNLFNHKGLDDHMYHILMLILVASIAISVHGLAHGYAEVNFNYNPLKGKMSYGSTW